MLPKPNLLKIASFVLIILLWIGCKNHQSVKEKEIVKTPEKMDDQVSENIKSYLVYAKGTNGVINDSLKLKRFGLVNSFYEKNNYQSVWSKKETWNPIADSMFDFIKNAKYSGLYPRDYHYKDLSLLRNKIEADSLTRMDAIAWTKADLMLTDAFMETLKDLKEGRMLPDSASIISKENYGDSFFLKNLQNALASGSVSTTFRNVEPNNQFYLSLKKLLPEFVDNMDTQHFVFLRFPYTDTLAFLQSLHERLLQDGIGKHSSKNPDSVELSREIKVYQAKHKLTADGKAGEETIRNLNSFDNEKFRRIAVTLDRFKQFPALPDNYLMVNLPSLSLKVWDHDTVVLQSKVIIGKPTTPTPLLSSSISNMVTFPNWTIPESIIRKDILPALKIDPGYLDSKGFSLVDNKGDIVDPYSVNWSKYKKGIPWKVVQASGADNALGIFKFNFNNAYSVYLHDTNQRYLFANSNRALSHGCVRVQNWESLAFYIAKRDSAANEGKHISYNEDSIKTWIATQSRKTIMVRKRLPIFIEYFTCEAKDDHIVFYKDVYGDDAQLEEKYFADK